MPQSMSEDLDKRARRVVDVLMARRPELGFEPMQECPWPALRWSPARVHRGISLTNSAGALRARPTWRKMEILAELGSARDSRQVAGRCRLGWPFLVCERCGVELVPTRAPVG